MNCLDDTPFFTFIGQTGSGKTELSVNWAIKLAHTQHKRVCFFDMDQTKGLFRARDIKEELARHGVVVFETVEFQDSPIVPTGVNSALEDPNNLCVFDVGGNAVGARMIGQYSEQLQKGLYLFVMNPNRPFFETSAEIQHSLYHIMQAGRIPEQQLKLISNPCMGAQTTPQSVLSDHRRLVSMLKEFGKQPAALTVESKFYDCVQKAVDCPVFPIELYIKKLYHII